MSVPWKPSGPVVEPRILRVGISGKGTELVLSQSAPICREQCKAGWSLGDVGEGFVGRHLIWVVEVCGLPNTSLEPTWLS